MVIWDDSFIHARKGGFGAGGGKPSKTFKDGFHLEPYIGFHFKLEYLYCFCPS